MLTLWAAVVGERLGLPHDTALTCGRAVAGMTAYAKGVLDLAKIDALAVRGHR